jgi:hypothetical protein
MLEQRVHLVIPEIQVLQEILPLVELEGQHLPFL